MPERNEQASDACNLGVGEPCRAQTHFEECRLLRAWLAAHRALEGHADDEECDDCRGCVQPTQGASDV